MIFYMIPCKEHQWEVRRILYYKQFEGVFVSERFCSICGWRAFDDWTSTRTGMEIRLLPPEKQNQKLNSFKQLIQIT